MFFAINLNASSLHLRFIFKAAYTFSRRIQWFQKIHQIAAKLKTNFFLTKLKMWWRTDAQSFLFETSFKLENTRMSHWYLLYASLDFRVIQRIFWTLCIVRDYRETNRKCFFSGNIDKYWCILLLLSTHRERLLVIASDILEFLFLHFATVLKEVIDIHGCNAI